MEDFESPPQDDAPFDSVEAEIYAERYRGRLLENARAVIPGILAAWVAHSGGKYVPPKGCHAEIVEDVFDYAELMLAEAATRAKVFQAKLVEPQPGRS